MRQDTFTKGQNVDALIYNQDYYSNVFKKTEKIVSGLLFILNRHEGQNKLEKDILGESIQKAAIDILELSSKILAYEQASAYPHLIELGRQGLYLHSLVEGAGASGRIHGTFASVLGREIESLVANLNDFKGASFSSRLEGLVSAPEIRKAPESRRETSEEVKPAGIDQESRREKIREVLQVKGQVSIKDISDTIKDVSEKSIQRDLNSMIKDGEVVRTGSRRWSTYSLR